MTGATIFQSHNSQNQKSIANEKHQLADQQKSAAYDFTHELLTTLEVDDPAMVAKQMELVLEGCLSRMLVNRSQADVDTAHRLAEDILLFARCRQGGALT